MAEEKNKKKKGKKTVGAMVAAILVPILMVVMIAAMFFAIIEAIIEFIKALIGAIINAILDFLEDPIGFLRDRWADFVNFLGTVGLGDSFDPTKFESERTEPSIIVPQTKFEEMKKNLENAINRNTAGLDDIMLKKMFLTYYRGFYLSDTDVLMELTEDEADTISSRDAYPFKIVEGNEEEGIGEEGKNYFSAKGLITVKKSGDKLLYYTEEALNTMYQKYYVEMLEKAEDADTEWQQENYEEFAEDALDYIEGCYTYGTSGIRCLEYIKDSYKKEWKYDGVIKERVSSSQTTTKMWGNVEFYEDISEYLVPMEFMVNLMEITGSKDFINAFMEMVGDNVKINMKLVTISNSTTKVTTNEKNRNIVITGKQKDIEYNVNRTNSWEVEQELNPFPDEEKIELEELEVIEIPVEGEQKIDIKVRDTQKLNSKIRLYVNGEEYEFLDAIKNLNHANNWEYIWTGLEKPDQAIRELTDTRKIIETETIEHYESKGDLVLTKATTWYAIFERSDNSRIDSTTYTSLTEEGEEINIPNENSPIIIPQPDEINVYTPGENPNLCKMVDIFNTRQGQSISISGEYKVYKDGDDSHWQSRRPTEEEILRFQYNYVLSQNLIQKGNWDKRIGESLLEKWDFYDMTVSDLDIKKYTVITTEERNVYETPLTMRDNTDLFLGLLSNEYGQYRRGVRFKAKAAGGKVVEYPDLYRGEAGVGELLENGAEMLFDLLESSEYTRDLVDIMRYIMYRYSGNNYGITSFNFSVFDLEEILGNTIIGETVEEKIWCSLINMGLSKEASAGVMANIQRTSNFDHLLREEIENEDYNSWIPSMDEQYFVYRGLCKWTDNREIRLKQYEEVRGTEESDPNAQIEFLMGELTEGGGCRRIC